MPISDIIIIGGGFAGSLAAAVFAKDGFTATLIDPHASFPPLFRADKLDSDQLDLLDRLDLREVFVEAATRVTRVVNVRGRQVLDRRQIEDYGISYRSMVTLLRERFPSNVTSIVGRAVNIETSATIQRVILANGEEVRGRLVIVATGGANALSAGLGVSRHIVRKTHSISVGFTLAPPRGGFAFPSLAAYGERFGDGVDYISLFPIGAETRANLFLYADLDDPRIAALRADVLPALFHMLPGLSRWLGASTVVGDTEVGVVDLTKCDSVARDGFVLIGDAFRTSCPAVGTGLSCIMVDVILLREHIARWMATPGMGAEKTATFYADPIKMERDRRVHADAIERRRAATETTAMRRMRVSARYAARAVRGRVLDILGREPASLRKAY